MQSTQPKNWLRNKKNIFLFRCEVQNKGITDGMIRLAHSPYTALVECENCERACELVKNLQEEKRSISNGQSSTLVTRTLHIPASAKTPEVSVQ